MGAHVVEQGDISGGGGIVIPISDALVPPHGNYDSRNPESHDFALMVLSEPVTYSDKGGITSSFFILVGSASFAQDLRMRRGDVHKSRDWKTPPTFTSSTKNLAYGIGVLNIEIKVGNWCLNSGQRGPDRCQESTNSSYRQP